LLAQWEVYSGLRVLNKPVDMIWLRKENAPHIEVQPLHRLVSQQAAVDWFTFWLQNTETADPYAREQYARWCNLRRLRDDGQGGTQGGCAADAGPSQPN
jgi:hypothetical protein